MASPARDLSKVDVHVSFVLSAEVQDVWDQVCDFGHAPWWNKAGRGEFKVQRMKGKSASEVGSGRVFNVGNGRLFEKLITMDDVKHRVAWALVPHPQTISPFGQASFINYTSTLRLWPVTVTKQTFVDWKGEFLTEPQHADAMEGTIANWYFAGLQSLQAFVALHKSHSGGSQGSQAQLIHPLQPAMMDVNASIPVAPPATDVAAFQAPREPHFPHQANILQEHAMMSLHGSPRWRSEGGRASDARLSNNSSSVFSPHTASVHNAKQSVAPSSDSSRNSHSIYAHPHSNRSYSSEQHQLQSIAEGLHYPGYGYQPTVHPNLPSFHGSDSDHAQSGGSGHTASSLQRSNASGHVFYGAPQSDTLPQGGMQQQGFNAVRNSPLQKASFRVSDLAHQSSSISSLSSFERTSSPGSTEYQEVYNGHQQQERFDTTPVASRKPFVQVATKPAPIAGTLSAADAALHQDILSTSADHHTLRHQMSRESRSQNGYDQNVAWKHGGVNLAGGKNQVQSSSQTKGQRATHDGCYVQNGFEMQGQHPSNDVHTFQSEVSRVQRPPEHNVNLQRMSSLDEQVAALQERHSLMHKTNVDQVCESPFAQPATPFRDHQVMA